MEEKKSHIEKWVEKKGDENFSKWLALISFTESSFFPIPPDPFVLVITCLKPHKWWIYATITSVASVLGGAFGYAIGFYFFDLIGQKIIDLYNLQSQFTQVGVWFEQHAFWSMFISAFTPIPYKIFTIAGGFFKINFFTFIVASIIGRSMRFFLVAFLAKVFGKAYGKRFLGFLDLFLIIVVILLVLYTIYSVM